MTKLPILFMVTSPVAIPSLHKLDLEPTVNATVLMHRSHGYAQARYWQPTIAVAEAELVKIEQFLERLPRNDMETIQQEQACITSRRIQTLIEEATHEN